MACQKSFNPGAALYNLAGHMEHLYQVGSICQTQLSESNGEPKAAHNRLPHCQMSGPPLKVGSEKMDVQQMSVASLRSATAWP